MHESVCCVALCYVGLASSGALSHLGPRPGQAAAGSSNYVHDVGSLYPAASGGAVPHGLAVHPLMAAAAGGQSQQSLAMQHPPSGLPLGTPLGFLPVTNRGDNPPCNTLFIGNLSDQVSTGNARIHIKKHLVRCTMPRH